MQDHLLLKGKVSSCS